MLCTYLHQNLSNIKKHLVLVLKNICVFQTNLNKVVNIFCTLLEWIRNIKMVVLQYYKDLDENLVRLSQKTEELDSNKGNSNFHTV